MQQRGTLVPMLINRFQAGAKGQQRLEHRRLAQLRGQDEQLARRLAPAGVRSARRGEGRRPVKHAGQQAPAVHSLRQAAHTTRRSGIQRNATSGTLPSDPLPGKLGSACGALHGRPLA